MKRRMSLQDELCPKMKRMRVCTLQGRFARYPFDLRYFLSVFSKPTPQQIDYLCAWFASVQLDPAQASQLCSACWGRNIEASIRQHDGQVMIRKEDFVARLSQFAPQCELNKLFPLRSEYYEDCFALLDVARTEEEVHSFFRSVFRYTYNRGKTCFVFKQLRYDRWGKRFVATEDFVVTKDSPFTGNSDRTLKLLIKGEEPKTKDAHLSGLFHEFMKGGGLSGYKNVVSLPYFKHDPSHIESINIWSGIP